MYSLFIYSSKYIFWTFIGVLELINLSPFFVPCFTLSFIQIVNVSQLYQSPDTHLPRETIDTEVQALLSTFVFIFTSSL